MDTIYLTSRRDDPFARVPKDILNDSSISWKAKGILSYLIGKPGDWKTRVADLVKRGTDGEAAVRSALDELRKSGYAELVQLREGKKIKEWVWKISDSKIYKYRKGKHRIEESDDRLDLDCDFQDVDFQDLENRDSTKKELKKNESTKKEVQMASDEENRKAQELFDQVTLKVQGELYKDEENIFSQKPNSWDEDL